MNACYKQNSSFTIRLKMSAVIPSVRKTARSKILAVIEKALIEKNSTVEGEMKQ